MLDQHSFIRQNRSVFYTQFVFVRANHIFDSFTHVRASFRRLELLHKPFQFLGSCQFYGWTICTAIKG